MGKIIIPINNFSAGELDPDLTARIDFEKYHSGCRTLQNMVPLVEGGAMRMPGSYYVLGANNVIAWNPDPVPHTIVDLANDGTYLYAVGALIYGVYYKAGITKLNMGGTIQSTVYYEPVANSLGFWNAVCVRGDYVYVAGTIKYVGETLYQAVIQKLNKSDLSLVWEYKYPIQITSFEMRDIDSDETDIYGVASNYIGTIIGRVRVAIADGSEVWRFQTTTLAALGIICDTTKVYITKFSTAKALDDITKSTGATTERTFEAGQFTRGITDGSSLYIAGYLSPSVNTGIHKIDIATMTQIWKYTDAVAVGSYYNCLEDIDGIYGYGLLTTPTLIKLTLAGVLDWKVSIAAGYVSTYAISQLGGNLFIGFTNSTTYIGTIQKRLKTTGALVT